MNFRFVLNQLGVLLIVLSVLLFMIGAWGFSMRLLHRPIDPHAMNALLASAAIGAVTGAAVLFGTRGVKRYLGRREALLLVALTWFVGAALAALPFFLWATLGAKAHGPSIFSDYAACYFEAMSGLTTTGATVLSGIDTMPRSLLLWRSTTHWLGGLGIVVIFVAVLPSVGMHGKKLFRVEAPGPSQQALQPNIRDTARVLLLIYLGLTAAALVLLRVAGMGWFDSVCHAFSCLSTGGLSTRDASIGHYDSVAIDAIIIFFMLVAGVNFALFFHMSQGRFRIAWKDVELRVYLVLKVTVVFLVAWNLRHAGDPIVTTAGRVIEPTMFESTRFAFFQTIALQTGTGFCTADYDLWPFFSQSLLIGLFFIGGCAGSTAGGVKIIRFWIAIKVMLAELERAFRPQVVRPLRIGGSTVDPEMKLNAVSYVLAFLMIFGLGTVLIKVCEPANSPCDFLTAMSASLSTLANVGPGLHAVGPTKNYGWFSDTTLLVMSVLMALGRLEMFAILILFTPRFWRND